MEPTAQKTPQFKAQAQRLLASIWQFLCSPRLTIGLSLAVLAAGLAGWLLPQQPLASLEGAVWIAGLPPWLQPWGDPLYLLGFARIFDSLWFWGPLALLLLNSLIALADYSPGARQRLGQTIPPLAWQHPLANRTETIVRLPKTPETFLNTVQEALRQHGFFVYRPAEMDQQRLVGAARRRWAWLGLPAAYVGLILLGLGLGLSHYGQHTERLTLAPLEPRASQLLAGKFELLATGPEQSHSQVTFLPAGDEPAPPTLNWRLFQPAWFGRALILPVASEPVLTVEVRDSTGGLRRLVPVQEELAPADRLNLPLAGSGEPLYLLVPSAGLALQIAPNPDSANTGYNVQVRRGSETAPSDSRLVRAGETFELDELSITFSLNRNLTVLARRDPGLLLYLLGGLLLAVGLGLTAGWPPVQVWLVPEVKGLGGRLYAVLEKPGPAAPETDFLEQLLAAAQTPTSEETGDSARAESPETTSNVT
ncbi:MAG: cytochrome c biogenesis protein ResB [Chloroflexota bacterium]